MQYKFEIKPKLEKKLKKIKNKDYAMFKTVRDKVGDIIGNPYHYKPLRYDLKGLRRVHIGKSHVLIFEIDEPSKTIRFLDLGHHDEIYGKRRSGFWVWSTLYLAYRGKIVGFSEHILVLEFIYRQFSATSQQTHFRDPGCTRLLQARSYARKDCRSRQALTGRIRKRDPSAPGRR